MEKWLIANRFIIFALLTALFFSELIRTAWLSDDSLITMRVVLNFLHGYGPNFNIDERVQAYTHPLWMLIIFSLSKISVNVFYTNFTLSIVISLACFVLIIRVYSNNMLGAVLASLVLIFSKSFIDYSTSGLENPLSHALVGVAIFKLLTKYTDGNTTLAGVLFLSSLVFLTRADLLLLIAPLMLAALFHSRGRGLRLGRDIAIGAAPALAWTLFSLFYYGSAFPNTAYAKLQSGVSSGELFVQGCAYFLDSISRDPVTLAAIATASTYCVTRSAREFACVLGVVLYLIYVLAIGGDFMTEAYPVDSGNPL